MSITLALSACAGGEMAPNTSTDEPFEDSDNGDSTRDAGDHGLDALGEDVRDAAAEDTVDAATQDATGADAQEPNPVADATQDTTPPSPDISEPGDEDATDSPDPQLPDATVNNCPGGCNESMVCRGQRCVSICEAAGVECGPAVVNDGENGRKNAQCRACSGAGEVCDYPAAQCVLALNQCTEQAAQCGSITWEGTTDHCGTCPSTSDICVQNRCAQPGHHQAAAGAHFSCAARSNGRVECWGDGSDHGELGHGSNASSTTPVQVSGLTQARKIAAGLHHTCALEHSGRAWCWGLNLSAQLGDNSQDSSNRPVQASVFSDGVDIGAGKSHSCLVRSNGQVWCWGLGEQGQLGNGRTGASANSWQPSRVLDLDTAQQVSLSDYSSCARLANHTVACWGAPLGSLAGSSTPQTIKNGERSTLTGVVDIATGNGHACAALNSGQIWCWGKGNSGQLGHGGPDGSDIAKKVQTHWNARQISAGDAHTCAVSTDNDVYCWGKNAHGQIGNGGSRNQLTPTKVSGLSNVLHVSAGPAHTCATKLDGSAWCWGQNDAGQLGDGTRAQRAQPVQVQ